MIDPQLTPLGTAPAQDEGRLFDRDVLRHILLAGTDVRWGSKLDEVEERPGGGVLARFAGGRVETADLLVGADGMGSTVRRQLQPEVDLGLRGVIGRTLLTDRFEPLVPGWSTFIAGEDVQLFWASYASTARPGRPRPSWPPGSSCPTPAATSAGSPSCARTIRWSPATTTTPRSRCCSPSCSPG